MYSIFTFLLENIIKAVQRVFTKRDINKASYQLKTLFNPSRNNRFLIAQHKGDRWPNRMMMKKQITHRSI